MEDVLAPIVAMMILAAIIIGIATGVDYINQKNTVTRVCIEIDWHSPTCEKLKVEKLKS